METSQPLSIESFSYSWLVNIKPSFEEQSGGVSIDDLDETSSFIEMDPKLPASRRFFGGSQDFDFPKSDSPITLYHADELISNGFLIPLFARPKKVEPFDHVAYSYTTPSTPVHSHAHSSGSDRKVRCSSFRRCKKLSKRVLKKCMEFVTPVFERFGGGSGLKTKADVWKRKEGSRLVCSALTSPRVSVAYSVDDWRRSCDHESSIYDAVLHCKRSIGK